MDTSQHRENLIERFRRADSSVVVAGHYCVAEDMQDLSHEGVEEASSFQLGARTVAAMLRNGRRSHLILWVNDIGIPPDQRSAIKATYRLPSNYQSILDGERVPQQNLMVCFESTMRNKASTLLRKLYKKTPDKFSKIASTSADLVRCVGDSKCDVARQGQMAYTIVGPTGERLVVKDGPNPKCNLILASLFNDLSKKYQPRVQINIFNELYSYRIGLGIHVFRALLENQMPIVNVFCDGNRYITQEMDVDVDCAMDCQSKGNSQPSLIRTRRYTHENQ